MKFEAKRKPQQHLFINEMDGFENHLLTVERSNAAFTA
jgi:hypothetical protein